MVGLEGTPKMGESQNSGAGGNPKDHPVPTHQSELENFPAILPSHPGAQDLRQKSNLHCKFLQEQSECQAADLK